MEERRMIDAVRTFANYAIVLMHASAAQAYVAAGTNEYACWDFICIAMTATVMPALFLISGYLLAKGYEGFDWRWWSRKCGRRVKRLLIPYLAWNALFVGFYLVASHAVPRLHQRVVSFGLTSWQGAFGKIVSFMIDPIDMPTWFMRTLVVYMIAAIVLLPLLRRFKGLLVYVILAGWFMLSWHAGLGAKLRFTYPFYSILCFVVGMHLMVLKKSPFEVFRSKWFLCLVIVGLVGFQWYRLALNRGCTPVRDSSFLLMTPLMFCIGPVLGRMAERITCWDFARNSSFFLYTGHFLFCSIVLHSIAPLFDFWQGPGKLTFLVAVFCTLGVTVNLGAYWLGKRFLGRMFGVLDGTL